MDCKVEIDDGSGFCFGVVTAIHKAEEELSQSGTLFSLGDIVHNSDEMDRLKHKGLRPISHSDLERLRNVKVLLRAHGEPPETYSLAKKNFITIIDATCPVVLKLQKRIKKRYDDIITNNERAQIVIYGQHGHAEVNGLVGQTNGTAIVVENESEIEKIDFSRPVYIYSQTTKSIEGFENIIKSIKSRMSDDTILESYDTICRNVAHRVATLKEFALSHDLILFVSDNKSSNGRYLFSICRDVQKSSYFIEDAGDIENIDFSQYRNIGICGATSTPRRLMEKIKNRVIAEIKKVSEASV